MVRSRSAPTTGRYALPLGGLVAAAILLPILARGGSAMTGQQQRDPLAEPFKGVTTDGHVVPGLFPIRATGVSTRPVIDATRRFLESLTPEQRAITSFAVDDAEWRKWNNVHRYDRQGVNFRDMSASQRELAFGLMRAGLSARGLEQSRNIMRLNGTIAELTGNDREYGEGLYHITVMGEPSPTEPWGWQLDGHHLIIVYFVLGDQVVMTPTFMGSEPIHAASGRFAGTTVLQDEQNRGLDFVRMLDADQLRRAVILEDKTGNNALAQAFRDNLVLDYAGLRATDLDDRQKDRLLAVIETYIGNMDKGHARVRMDEVRAHLDETRFAWIGGTGPDAIFYYRIQSPVILIEFDHQSPVALPGPRVPGRDHIHTVVRTPNGNDYGKDLLRQHYEAHRNDPAHGHAK